MDMSQRNTSWLSSGDDEKKWDENDVNADDEGGNEVDKHAIVALVTLRPATPLSNDFDDNDNDDGDDDDDDDDNDDYDDYDNISSFNVMAAYMSWA